MKTCPEIKPRRHTGTKSFDCPAGVLPMAEIVCPVGGRRTARADELSVAEFFAAGKTLSLSKFAAGPCLRARAARCAEANAKVFDCLANSACGAKSRFH
jgi:hypothetical protein